MRVKRNLLASELRPGDVISLGVTEYDGIGIRITLTDVEVTAWRTGTLVKVSGETAHGTVELELPAQCRVSFYRPDPRAHVDVDNV